MTQSNSTTNSRDPFWFTLSPCLGICCYHDLSLGTPPRPGGWGGPDRPAPRSQSADFFPPPPPPSSVLIFSSLNRGEVKRGKLECQGTSHKWKLLRVSFWHQKMKLMVLIVGFFSRYRLSWFFFDRGLRIPIPSQERSFPKFGWHKTIYFSLPRFYNQLRDRGHSAAFRSLKWGRNCEARPWLRSVICRLPLGDPSQCHRVGDRLTPTFDLSVPFFQAWCVNRRPLPLLPHHCANCHNFILVVDVWP